MKIYASVFVTKVAKPMQNAEKMIEIMQKNEANIYLFPAYCLTGVSCSDLVHFQSFANETNEALDRLCEYSENEHKCIVTAVAGYENIIIRDGDLIQKGSTTIDGKKIIVAESGDENGGDILLLPTAMAGYPCIQNDIIEFCAESSKTRKCVIAVANQGFGESSSDNVYKGFAGIFNRGIIVDFKGQEAPEEIAAKADSEQQTGLIYTRPNRGEERFPYYGKNEPTRYLNELFLLQVQALYTRIQGSQKQHLVLELDGQASSAVALLVSVQAMKMCELDPKQIFAVCIGDSESAAVQNKELAEALGVTYLSINPIRALDAILYTADMQQASQQTAEGCMQRLHTQILQDLAQQHDALLVGSADLTDIALGSTVFGGIFARDYNVNASVPKTVLNEQLKLQAEKYPQAKSALTAIAEASAGRIQENAEDLIDFALFFFAKRHTSYSDIKNYCLAVFEELDEDEIVEALDRFLRQYKQNQAKRSTVYEGANLIGFKLPYFPADIDYDLI